MIYTWSAHPVSFLLCFWHLYHMTLRYNICATKWQQNISYRNYYIIIQYIITNYQYIHVLLSPIYQLNCTNTSVGTNNSYCSNSQCLYLKDFQQRIWYYQSNQVFRMKPLQKSTCSVKLQQYNFAPALPQLGRQSVSLILLTCQPEIKRMIPNPMG